MATTLKKPVKKLPAKKSAIGDVFAQEEAQQQKANLTLAERFAAQTAEVVVPKSVITRGPLGNFDFVPFGSDAHAALLGFEDASAEEMTLDLATLSDKGREAFIRSRKAMLHPATLPKSYKVPEAWHPEPEDELGLV